MSAGIIASLTFFKLKFCHIVSLCTYEYLNLVTDQLDIQSPTKPASNFQDVAVLLYLLASNNFKAQRPLEQNNYPKCETVIGIS